MKKNYSFILIIILIFILVLLFSFFNKNINKNINIENINKSIVKIVAENELISFSNNPSGINKDLNNGIGTGFFINKEGLILTSKHILGNNNTKFFVITSDNNKYEANVINLDSKNDLAYLKIKTQINYNFLNITNKIFNINDEIYIYGLNKNNFKITFKKGKILNKNKKLDNISNLIEFSPEISKGFSGGPILNSKFELIGINFAIKNGKSYGIDLLNILNDS